MKAVGKKVHNSLVEIRRLLHISPDQMVVPNAEQSILAPNGLRELLNQGLDSRLEQTVVFKFPIAFCDVKDCLRVLLCVRKIHSLESLDGIPVFAGAKLRDA